MQQTKKIGYLLAAGATFGSMGAAHADTLTITFSQQVVAAPLSPWLTAAIALALTLMAVAVFRGKRAGRLFLLGAGVLIVAGGLVVEKTVMANIATPLVTSPYTQTFCNGSINQNYTSASGTITLNSVTDNGIPGGSTLTAGTTCTPGTVLTPSTFCAVITTVASCVN